MIEQQIEFLGTLMKITTLTWLIFARLDFA